MAASAPSTTSFGVTVMSVMGPSCPRRGRRRLEKSVSPGALGRAEPVGWRVGWWRYGPTRPPLIAIGSLERHVVVLLGRTRAVPAGRQTGQRAEVVDEVGLVEVAVPGRHLRPVDAV